MPVEDQNEFHETILRGNLSMDINTNSNTTSQQPSLTGGYSPESVPSTDSNFSTSVKSNLSHSSNRPKSEVHRVTFSESHCVKEVDSGNISVIQDVRYNTTTTESSRPLPGGREGESMYSSPTSADPASSRSWATLPPSILHTAIDGGSGSGRRSYNTKPGRQPPPPFVPPPILRLQKSPSTESHENPFQNDGMLSKKADYIVRNSTISRTELKIADPDSERERRPAEEEVIAAEVVTKSEAAPVNQASPPGDTSDGPERPNDIKVKENGKVEEPLTPQSVEVEVGKANASQPQAQQAEEVKLPKNKKCKCCVVQ